MLISDAREIDEALLTGEFAPCRKAPGDLALSGSGTIKTALRRTDGLAVTEHLLPDCPDGLFVAHSDPDGSTGRYVEFYHLKQLLESVGLKPDERRKACQP